jgi:shikimate dehydrogenase
MQVNHRIINTYGLIGKSLSHSFSRSYFTEKFERLDLKDHVYRNFEVEDEGGLIRFRESVKNDFLPTAQDKPKEALRGLNVTIPYKQAIINVLDEVSEEAKTIGAVNTVVIDGDQWYGHNTDAFGFAKSLQPLLPVKGNALVLGTGGASLAIRYVLESLSIPYLVVSRNPKGTYQIGYKDIDKSIVQSVGMIVNCTPVGTYPNTERAVSIPYQYLNQGHICYDLVYNPSETLFMKKARYQGATAVNGHEMLVQQAEQAWSLWNQ